MAEIDRAAPAAGTGGLPRAPMHAEFVPPVETVPSPRSRWIGLAVSLLVHLIAGAVLFVTTRPDRPAMPDEEVIEVVFVPAPAAALPPAPPPRPLDLPLPRLTTPPEAPQLVEAPIARESNAPVREQAQGRQGETRQAAAPRPIPAPAPPPPIGPGLPAPRAEESLSTPMLIGRSASLRRSDNPAAQALKDNILSQIVPFWTHDYKAERFAELVLGGTVVLQADGMLGPPFGKNDPFDPRKLIRNYDVLQHPSLSSERSLIINFLHALRQAQPLRLPRGTDLKYPAQIDLAFRLGDL